MTTLLSVPQLRRTVQSDLDDVQLQELIAEEETELIRRFGPHADGTIQVTEQRDGGGDNIFLNRPVLSVVSVAERTRLDGSDSTLATTQYLVRPAGRLTRINASWGALVTVVYVPADDQAIRCAVITELVRLRLTQRSLKGESVGGEYSYTAPDDWEAVRRQHYRRLKFEGF